MQPIDIEKDNTNMKKLFLDKDNDCHWYIIDANKRYEWNKWLNLNENDPLSWKVPSFAKEINSNPNQVEFYLEKENSK